MRLAPRLLLAVALAAVGVCGCLNPFSPRVGGRGISVPPPTPETAVALLKLFQWCWEHRSIDLYRDLFTDDFRFAFAVTDPSGDAYRDRGFTREDELKSAEHLFQGGDITQPRANRISMEFTPRNPTPFPDSRPGKIFPWHVEVRTEVDITIDTDEATTRIISRARFYMVRGDSALIPPEMRDRGFRPDPSRWYIERYDEEVPTLALVLSESGRDPGRAGADASRPTGTEIAGGARPPAPEESRAEVARGARGEARHATWGQLKTQYRN